MKPVFWFWPSKYVKKLNITDIGITLKVSSDEFKKKALWIDQKIVPYYELNYAKYLLTLNVVLYK